MYEEEIYALVAASIEGKMGEGEEVAVTLESAEPSRLRQTAGRRAGLQCSAGWPRLDVEVSRGRRCRL